MTEREVALLGASVRVVRTWLEACEGEDIDDACSMFALGRLYDAMWTLDRTLMAYAVAELTP